MNKITYYLFFVFVFLLLACHNDDINDVYKDYRFKTKVSTDGRNDPDNLYLNGVLPLKIGIEKNDPDIGTYHFSYVPEQGKGMLWYKDSLLTPGIPVTLQDSLILLEYIPTTSGIHSVKFNFKNDNLSVADKFTGRVRRQFFQLKPNNLPQKFLVDNPSVFNVELIAPDEETGNFKTNVLLTDGSGNVFILNTHDSVPSKPSDYLLKGYNKVSFTGTKQGLHNLRFIVCNKYSLSQTIDIPLHVEYPDYSFRLLCDTSLQAGKSNFILKVDNTDHHPDNHYWATFRPIQNSGSLFINNNPLESGNLTEVKAGENICEFTPQELGATQLEFILRDKYSTIKKDTVTFNVTESSTDIQITNFTEECHVYDLSTFNLAVSKKNYSGQYKIEILQEPLNGGVFINGNSYSGGRIPLLNKDNTLIGFVPKNIGDCEISVVIYDDYNSTSTKTLNYKVINTEGQIIVSNQNPSVKVSEKTNFNFAINKPKYENDFLFEITCTPTAPGSLSVNGKGYTGGKIKVDNADNTLVSFIPQKTGYIVLHITVYDQFGGSMTEDIPYSVTNTTIQVGVTNLEKDLLIGKETSFTMTVNKPFFSSEQDLQFSVSSDPLSQGVIYINNQYYLPGSVVRIKNQSSQTITYFPGQEGKAILNLNIWDDYMGTVNYPVTFNITNPPIKVEITDYSENICINTENKLNFSVSKNGYKGKFKINIVPSSGKANLKINGTVYEGGFIDLESPENNMISFTPNTSGVFDLKIQITDETKAKTEKNIRYNVSNPELQLHLLTIENDLSIYQKGSFSFAVTKSDYTGKFYFELFSENCKEVKIGNLTYPNGEKQILNTPSGSTVSFIPTEVGIDTVKMRLKVYDEWGGVLEKQIAFTVNNSSLNFQVTNFESQLPIGRTNSFVVKADKPQYHGSLNIEIEQNPVCGQFHVNGETYISGKRAFSADEPLMISYTPEKAGTVSVKLTISDQFGDKKSSVMEYDISNPDLHLDVTDFVSAATYNVPNYFYVSAHKMYYEDAFMYVLTTEPVNAGTLKYNDTLYTGGRISHGPEPVKFSFIPSVSGNVVLHLSVTDKTGLTEYRDLRYFVATYPLEVVISNQETSLTVNKTTSFNFSTSKKEYKGKYLFEITQEPVSAGTIKVDNSIYHGGKAEITNITNTLVNFTPDITGDIRLLLKIYDEQGVSANKEIKYSVANSNFEIIGSNQEKEIILGRPTTFNMSIVKSNYAGSYRYEIEQSPINAGTILMDGTPYTGGKLKLNNPVLSVIRYTSNQPDLNSLIFRVYDEFGAISEKTFNFNVLNPVININVTNKADDLIYNTQSHFNVTVGKEYYKGGFKFQIEQIPAEAGTLLINGEPYAGGVTGIADPANLQIGFIPLKEGNVALIMDVWDDVSGKAQETLNFAVENPDIDVVINSYPQDIVVNTPSQVNFAVSKKEYDGLLYARISMQPAAMGTIKMNGIPYVGEKITLTDLNNNLIEFTANKVGAVSLGLEVSDDWGKTCNKQIAYSVSNSDIKITTTGKEYELLLNKATSLSFSVDKPNYSDTFDACIIMEPETAGELKINGSSYQQGWQVVKKTDNLFEFIPKITGAILLKLKIKDALGGEKEIPLSFNTTNPPININIANQQENIGYNIETRFNVSIDKEYYNQGFDIQIEQTSAASGSIKINDKPYSGGIEEINDPQNIQIGFTAVKEGHVSLLMTIKDKVFGTAQKTLDFEVVNPAIGIGLSSYTPDIIVHSPSSVNFTITKYLYKGQFKAQLFLQPADCGVIKLNGSTYKGEEVILTDPHNNLIEFIATQTGAATIQIKVSDSYGKNTTQIINYSISNSDMRITTAGKEFDLFLNKQTNLSFAVDKPNYSGSFQAQIVSDPSVAGQLRINNSSYDGGWVEVKSSGNQLEFTPQILGAALLNLRIKDDLGGEKEIALNYNVSNPPIDLVVINFTTDLTTGQAANFGFQASKKNYDGQFKFEITPYPYGSGNILVNGKNELTGQIGKTEPVGIDFTPTMAGTITFNIKVTDTWGSTAEKQINFNVTNTPVEIKIFNHEQNIILNQTTNFNLAVKKDSYSDDQSIYYSVSPAKNLTIDGIVYNGGILQTKFSKIKTGIPVSFTPTQVGNASLSIYVHDEYNQTNQKEIDFNITNPDLKLFLSGVSESGENHVNFNETFKFTFNVTKDFYNDEFAYWITTTPSDAAIVATNDITPRSQVNDYGTITGVINNSNYGMSSAEIRLTPNNPVYLNQNITTEIRARDKWGNEEKKTVEFHVGSSEIMINIVRNNVSIPVLQPYQFYFTVTKPNYDGIFKYSIIGTADDDVLEISDNGSSWIKYLGGKFEVTSPDHMYIRFTPGHIGTVPLKLVVYDTNDFYTEKDVTTDVKAPEIQLTGGGLKTGNTETFIPFDITATEGQGNNLTVNFNVDDELDGTVLFNSNTVYNNLKRSAVKSSTTIQSGKTNKMEMMSRKQGTYNTQITATNNWNSRASVTSTIEVSKPIYFKLNVSQTGEGNVGIQPQSAEYMEGEKVTLTAIPVSGWKFVRWEGDLSGSVMTQQIIINSDKNIKAIFEKKTTMKAYFNLKINIHVSNENFLSNIEPRLYVDIKDDTGAIIYEGFSFNNGGKEEVTDIEADKTYDIEVRFFSPESLILNVHSYLVKTSETFSYILSDGQAGNDTKIRIKGSDLINGINVFKYEPSYLLKQN